MSPVLVLGATGFVGRALVPRLLDEGVTVRAASRHPPWFDVPGPDELSAREMLFEVAALQGRRIPAVRVPVLTPSLSAMWLKLVTRTDYRLARELVLGLTGNLLPHDERYFELTGHRPRVSFDDAARAALEAERHETGPRALLGRLEERLVRRVGPRAA